MTVTLTRLAIENRAILESLDQGIAPSTLDAFSKQLQRDASNVRKSLKGLAAEGILQLAAKPGEPQAALTEAGRTVLAGIYVAEGRLQAGLPVLVRDQITPDPDQPRKQFDQAELEELAESIADRGLLEPILVRLTGDNSAQLVAGERRWRAIGLLIAAADPRWPADRPVPYHLSVQTEDAEILADQVVENLQRAKLHPLEEAEAFRTLKVVHGWGVGRIAKTASKTRRFIEQRLDLLTLTPIQQGRMRLAKDHPEHLTPSRAREMVQHLRQISGAALDQRDIEEIAPGADVAAFSAEDETAARKPKLTPRELMVLGEIAAAAEAKPSNRFGDIPGPIADVDHAQAVADHALRTLDVKAGLASLLIDADDSASFAGARVEDLGHLRLRLENLHPADNPRALFHLRREAGISADQARQLQKAGQMATPFLTLPEVANIPEAEAAIASTPEDPRANAQWFSIQVREAALAEARKRPGHERDMAAKISGTVTVEGEAWPAMPTETLKTDWTGYPSAEIELTVSDRGRWFASTSSGQGGPSYSSSGSPPFVYSCDPLFASRQDALVYAIAKITKQLGDWSNKRNIKQWFAGLLADDNQAAEALEEAAPTPPVRMPNPLQCPVIAPEWRLPWITIVELRSPTGGIGYEAILRVFGYAQTDDAVEFLANGPLALSRKAEGLQRRLRDAVPIEVMDWFDQLQGEHVVDGHDYYNATRAAEARAARGATDDAPEDPAILGELTEPQIRILREVDHAAQTADATTSENGPLFPVGQYWLDADAVGLWKRAPDPLLSFTAAPGATWNVALTEVGRNVVRLLNVEMDPLALAMRIEREGYSCAWLRHAGTPIGEQLGEDLGDDDAAEESELLIEIRAALAAGAPDPGKLLQLVGLRGDFVADVDAGITLSPMGGGQIVYVAAADPHRLEPEDLACARAELIAFALNAFARNVAHWPATEAA